MTTVSPAAPPPRYQGRAPLEAEGEGYRLRTGPDRRRRPLMTLTEAQFLLLVAEPVVKATSISEMNAFTFSTAIVLVALPYTLVIMTE